MIKNKLLKNILVIISVLFFVLSCNNPTNTINDITNKNNTSSTSSKVDNLKENIKPTATPTPNNKVTSPTNKNPFLKEQNTQKPANFNKRFNIQLLDNVISNISGTSGLAKNSSIVVDSSGIPHVVWESKTASLPKFEDYYTKYDNTTETWNSSTKVTTAAATDIVPKSPSVTVDSVGNTHLVFLHGRVLYYSKADSTGTWTPPTQLANLTATENVVKIVCTINSIHIVWTNNNDVWYSYSTDSGDTWRNAENISNTPNTKTTNPSLAVDTLDIPYVTWEESTLGAHNIYYSRKDTSVSWQSPKMVSDTNAYAMNPSISLDGTFSPSIVWEQDNGGFRDIFYTKNPDNTKPTVWTNIVNISNSPKKTSINPKIVSDSLGYSYVAWEESGDGIYFGKQVDKVSNVWSSPVKVSQATIGKSYKNPSIARDLINGSVHITWESNIDNPLFSIYHIKKPVNPPTGTNRSIRVTTNKGVFEFVLFEDKAPITASNFIDLTLLGFYNGLTYHRYEPGFVIQGGDPTTTGNGGSGVTIPLEINPQLNFNTAGIVGMARTSDPNSASSQYFITLDAAPFLNNNYAVFGQVTSGMDVVLSLVQGDVMNTVELI
ncbi:MAG: peptidylprolyl isomerase [Candidatus Sericytochromatia bacterium]